MPPLQATTRDDIVSSTVRSRSSASAAFGLAVIETSIASSLANLPPASSTRTRVRKRSALSRTSGRLSA